MKIQLPIRIQRLHIWNDGCTWVVAFDTDDAREAYCEYTGDKWDDSYDPFDNKVEDTKEFRIHCERDDWDDFWKHRPIFSHADLSNPDFPTIVAPAWAWALQNGRGFLSSTEY